jgi:hypothetical protein
MNPARYPARNVRSFASRARLSTSPSATARYPMRVLIGFVFPAEGMRLDMRRSYRIAFRACYFVTVLAGTAAARLAADFRELGRAGPVAVVLQLPVVACWAVARGISCAGFAGCCALAPRLSETSRA